MVLDEYNTGEETLPLKAYFRDKNGCEMKDHPLNGMELNGAGCALSVRGTDYTSDDAAKWADRQGRIARHTIYGWDFKKKQSFPVTIADFPGHRHVLVKEWVPRGAQYEAESFWLVPKENRVNS